MKFLTGLGIGLGLGLLYAPKRGQELRSELGDKVSEMSDKARQKVGDVKDRVSRGVESLKKSGETATGTQG
jgi:gas vesicle protein